MSDAVAHADVRGHAVHHPALQHHFDTMEQQKEAAVIGMWTFLLTEILFFGGLFMAYMLYRIWYHDAFVVASKTLDLRWGGLNTVVLIASSLTMAMGVHSAQLNKQNALINWLLATIFLGAVFLGVKVIEYSDKFEHHHVPGPNYVWESHAAGPPEVEHRPLTPEPGVNPGDQPIAHAPTTLPLHPPEYYQRTTQIYFSLYFTMTGLHALHMIVGIGLMSVIAWMAWIGKFDANWYTPVEMSGLYWHFVDIVWIYLFPLLYLIDRS